MNPFVLAKIGSLAQKYWVPLALVAVIVLALSLSYCAGGRGAEIKQQSAVIEQQQKVGAANDAAATTRVEDAVVLEQQKQELSDAIEKSTSDADLRRKRGCVILRQQGRDTSVLSACR